MGQSVGVSTGEADAHCRRGDAFHRLAFEDCDRDAHLARAAECYREALSVQPRHVPALNNLGALLAESGHAREALAYLEAAAALRPTDATIQHNLAETLRGLRQRERANKRDDLAHHLQPGLGTWVAHVPHKGLSASA